MVHRGRFVNFPVSSRNQRLDGETIENRLNAVEHGLSGARIVGKTVLRGFPPQAGTDGITESWMLEFAEDVNLAEAKRILGVTVTAEQTEEPMGRAGSRPPLLETDSL